MLLLKSVDTYVNVTSDIDTYLLPVRLQVKFLVPQRIIAIISEGPKEQKQELKRKSANTGRLQ